MRKTFYTIHLAAYVLLLFACSRSIKGDLLFVDAVSEEGFNFPYFLFVPEQVPTDQEVILIVEPNNSGFVHDDLQEHIEKAERTTSLDYYMGNYLARSLKYPLLVPVFPRTESSWKVYTHAMDRDVMLEKGSPLERIDLQLLKMCQHAKSLLTERSITCRGRILLTGFSASGTFANRFTALHPESVQAVAAGGLNGLLIIPQDCLNGKTLQFPVGVGDLHTLTSLEFQREAFLQTPQFYFMGANDDNDAVPYDDAFDSKERTLIYELLGEEMLPLRWNKCRDLYKSIGANAVIKTYPKVGHEHPEAVKEEVVDFFKSNINDN